MTETPAEPENEQAAAKGDEADWIKELRKKANRVDQAEERVVALERRIAFDEVGIPSTGAGKLFREAWSGDPADRDALRSAAREYELIPPEGDQPDPTAVGNALDGAAGMAEVAAAGASATPTAETLLAEAPSIDEIERIAQDVGIGVPIR